MSRFVYFIKPIGMDGPVKIGCSAEPESRLVGLMVWSPFPLEVAVMIPGTFALEKNIHQCLSQSHSHKEWFKPTLAVRQLIAKLRRGVPIEEAIDLSKHCGKLSKRRPVRSARNGPRHNAGSKLKAYLLANGINAAEFAEKVGVTRQAVNLWCSEDRTPRRDALSKIAEATAGAVMPADFFEKPTHVEAAE